MRPRLVGWVAVTTVLVAACRGGGGGSSARLTLDGRAEISTGGGQERTVDGGRTLHVGDRVKVDSGTAVLRLSSGRQLELRRGSHVALTAGAGRTDVHPVLLGGDALVMAGAATTTVTAGESEVSVGGGAARVSRGLAVTIGSYTAAATVESVGRALPVPPLRQVTVVAAGVLPGRPAALVFDAKDSWDQRFLGDAIDLGNQLVARSRGFTAQLGPNEGRSAGFYRQILPALDNEPSFDLSLLGPDRSPGEALVGLAIAVQGTRGSFVDRTRAVFAFHDDGAAWGLVALDQGVSSAPLLARVDEAIGRQPTASEAQVPKAPLAPGASTPTTARPRSPDTITSRPSTTAPPVNTAPPRGTGPVNTGVPLVDNTVKGLVDLLSGLLGQPSGR